MNEKVSILDSFKLKRMIMQVDLKPAMKESYVFITGTIVIMSVLILFGFIFG